MSDVVGRDAELRAVEAFLGPRDAGPRVLAIAGEAGIGKTTLWTSAVEDARATGSAVLVARPVESEARLSFVGLADLLSGLPDDVFVALPSPQRAALDVALLRASARRAPARRLVGTALLSLLRALAREQDVVVAVDDLQWLDTPSAAALEFALRRIGDEPIRAVLSFRPEGEEHSPVSALMSEGRVESIVLGPLSVAALHRVLARELGQAFPRPTLVRIATASGGNALHAIEIARLIVRTGDAASFFDLPVPESLRSLVAARVRSLPVSTRNVLLESAMLAKADLGVLDAEALAPAEEAGLVRIRSDERVEFVHPLYASAVYASASTARRRATHRRLADVVEDKEERGRHLALGCAGRDERVALEVEEAAEFARLRGAPDAAAELTELALRLLPPASLRHDELRLRLAEHLYLASDFWRASGVLDELCRSLEPSDLRARALLALSEIDYWRFGESASLVLCERALADARDPLLRARCFVGIASAAGTVDLPRAADAARGALELLEASLDPEPGLFAAALAARVRTDLFLGRGFDASSAAKALELEAEDPPAVVDGRVVFKLGQWCRYVDDFDGARARYAEAEAQAQAEGDESSVANILLNRVILETWAGELAAAMKLARRMVEAFAQQGVDIEAGRLWQAYVDAYAGRVEEVRLAARVVDSTEPIVVGLWSRSLGLAELAAGDPEAADRHLADALEHFDAVDFREPAIWRVHGDAIEAALSTGNPERADRLLDRFEEGARASRIPWSLAVSARCRGLVLAAAGELESALDHVERALVEHERCPMPFERARTLLARGQILRRLKRKREARASLERALEVFAQIGADLWASRTEDELRRVAVRRAPEELSATELQIARLAASGLTNKAIAEQAFVSINTVEANLRRAYRKLGIRSRAQLARELDKRPAPIS